MAHVWDCPSMCINCDQFTMTSNKGTFTLQCWLPPMTITIALDSSKVELAKGVQYACIGLKIFKNQLQMGDLLLDG